MKKEPPCPFCNIETDDQQQIILSNDHCLFLQIPQEVLKGSGIIIPKAHRKTVFNLSSQEWNSTFQLLQQVKQQLDAEYQAEGYNVGWNTGAVAGQEVFHAHLHVIPRFKDEPLAGKGIRHWIKQPENRRG